MLINILLFNFPIYENTNTIELNSRRILKESNRILKIIIRCLIESSNFSNMFKNKERLYSVIKSCRCFKRDSNIDETFALMYACVRVYTERVYTRRLTHRHTPHELPNELFSP